MTAYFGETHRRLVESGRKDKNIFNLNIEIIDLKNEIKKLQRQNESLKKRVEKHKTDKKHLRQELKEMNLYINELEWNGDI